MSRNGQLSTLAGVIFGLLLIILFFFAGSKLLGSQDDVLQLGERYCEESELTAAEMGDRLTRELGDRDFAVARAYYDSAVEPCFGPDDIPFNGDQQRVDLFCHKEFSSSDHKDLVTFREDSCE